jgi:AGCS family alanine or glycine:cation symporter
VAPAALALVVLLAISAGLRGVARLMQWLVPVMALLWVAASLFVAALHITRCRRDCDHLQKRLWLAEAASGALGYTISQALTSGFQRACSPMKPEWVNPNAAAAASSWPPHPAAQGIVQMIGVFIDTIMICPPAP